VFSFCNLALTCLANQAPEPRLAEIIIKEISNAKKVVNAKEHVERRQPVTKQYFQETLDSLRGAVMIAFPEGLPEWVRVCACVP
jgi:cilia- and flagella-associated protein 298